MDAKICAEVIAQRRMVTPGAMSDRPVPRDVLEQLLEAANWAPSHRRTEPWRFVVVQGAALEHLSQVYIEALEADRPDADERTRLKVANKPLRSPVVIGVVCQPSDLAKVVEHEEEWAVACAIQNMGVLARALGVSVFWSTGFPSAHPHVAQAFGCSGRAKMMGVLHVGYPDDNGWPTGRRGAWQDKVHWCEADEIDVPTWRPNPDRRSTS